MSDKRELRIHEANNICPCKECHAKNQSYTGCHDKCLKYIDWKQKKEVIRSHVQDMRYKEHLLYKKERRNK